MQKKLTRRDGSLMTLAQSKRASELQKDMNAWEENRMMTSGVARLREVGCLMNCCSQFASLDTSKRPAPSRVLFLAFGPLPKHVASMDGHPRLR